MGRMTMRRVVVGMVSLVLLASGVADAHERQPALQRVEVRDSGLVEPAFTPRREVAARVPKVSTATFEVTYNDFTAEAQAAFQQAVDIWSSLITSTVPIRVEANWESLDETVLGNAGANYIHRGFTGAPEPLVWYVDAVADQLAGRDLAPGEPDIVATFNADFDDWYLGTDGQPPVGTIDFVTVVLHELCHGIGFVGSGDVDDDGIGSWGQQNLPIVYDTFPEDGGGNRVLDTAAFPNPSEDLAAVLQGDDLFWGGPGGTFAAGGTRPRLYAPSEWDPGSSFSHLDEATYRAGNPHALMTPLLSRSEVIRDPGSIALCMMEDMGWTTAASCGASNTIWVAVAARAEGVGGSLWRTRLGLFNREAVAALADLRLRTAEGLASATVAVPAGGQVVIDDVVGFIGTDGNGSLEVMSDQPLTVGSRTYNLSVNGTYGQYLDGVDPAVTLAAGDTVWLTLLEESPDFRTNIGFTNTSEGGARVRATLFDSSGTVLAVFERTIPAGRNVQENQVFVNRAGTSDVRAALASVTVLSGQGVIVYGSVVDNLTGDPTTIPAKP
jgi:hypothetical protein